MSDTVAGLQRKMGSATELQSVVRTMKALAAANIGQYEHALGALSDYDRVVEDGLSLCVREGEPAAAAVARGVKAHAGTTAVVVFGSDQGLVGRFNEVVADEALAFLGELGAPSAVWAVGERVHGRLAASGLKMAGLFPVPGSVRAVAPLVSQILLQCGARGGLPEGSELQLFHHRPIAGAAYRPVRRRVLPLDAEWLQGLAAVPWPTRRLPEVVGGQVATLRAFIGEYLFVALYRACAESLASENASRLAAMQRADKNISDLLETLRGHYHQLRQSGIDEELFDVVSGFEAMSKREAKGPH